MSNNLDGALSHAGRGWKVFPCKANKAPYTDDGFKSGTTDNDQIRVWWKRWPDALIGVYCEGSNFFAVDVDPDPDPAKDGRKSWDRMVKNYGNGAAFDKGPSQKTPSGGYHILFKMPQDVKVPNNAGKLAAGLDLRSNGYVILAPSPGYTWFIDHSPDDLPLSDAPGWLLDAIENTSKRKEPNQAKPLQPIEADDPGEYWLKHYLGITSKGNRNNNGFELACQLRDSGLAEIDAGFVMQSFASLAPGGDYTENEALAAMRSAYSQTPRKPASLPLASALPAGELVTETPYIKQAFNFTDVGNAERFVSEHKDKIRYCAMWKKWLVWDGKRWTVDDTLELRRLAYSTVRGIYAQAANEEDDKLRTTLAKHALRSENRSRIDAMIDLAGALVAIKDDQLDQNPMLLNVENGTIDLRTGKIKPHERADLITKLIDIPYDELADCPKWHDALSLFTGGDKDLAYYLQVAVGYTLTGKTDADVLFFLYGLGANGKTTFLELLRHLLGDYFVKISMGSILAGFDDGKAATPDVALMAGARMVLASEVAETRKLNEGLIKDLTGGDAIRARLLFSNPVTFTPTHKLWIYGNHEPKIVGTDEGIWRRIQKVPFVVTIPPKQREPMSEILEGFIAESPGILAWAVTGCLAWQKGGLPQTKAVAAATKEYRTEQDIVMQFLSEMTVSHPDYEIPKVELWNIWRDWAKESGDKETERKSKNWFTSQLTRRYGFKLGGAGNSKLIGLDRADKMQL